MDLSGVMLAACRDELSKIAVSKGLLRVAQSRKGRRPMRVSTLLKKEKDGTLYKRSGSEQSSLYYSETDPKMGSPASPKSKKGDAPSREGDTATVSENRRDTAGTVLRGGLHEVDAYNKPAEHS